MQQAAKKPGLGLGTFLGVFTPTVLTILGVILFLRLGWVVGNAGVGGTLLIVLFAHAITFITAFSLSALATNMRVGVGGAYYIISRSLGLELGGALGIPLYLSQALSVTLYAYGLAESLRIVWPGVPVELVAALIVVGVVLVASKSTVLALKMQLPIMGLITLALLSLVVGVGWAPPKVDFNGVWVDAGFWTVFAVFFPAVTGVLAGVGLSGDLRDPGRSIPTGVLAAVAVGFVVYMGVPLVLARAADAGTLREDALIWTRVARVGWLVMPGLWGAILSSALGSILGAPRTLQALAADKLAPAFLARTDGATGEPMLALRISGGVALLAVALGDLNAVATVVTMFFLTTYGMLNLAAGLEDLIKDPSFRPRIRVPWMLSFAGALGCFVAMFAINPLAFLVAILIEAGIWWGLRRRMLSAAWGDLRTGLWFAMARFSLLQIRYAHHDPRNWRPLVLVFTHDLTTSLGMVSLASLFSQGRGIVTVSTLLVGDPRALRGQAQRLQARNAELLDKHNILAFPEVITVPDLETGFPTVAQANGFASMASNMVMFGWPRDPQGLRRLLREVRYLAGLQKSTAIVRPIPGSRARGNGQIVVWWKGRQHNGDLMLLLAHLLNLAEGWRGHQMILKSVADDEQSAQTIRAGYQAMLAEIRIDAQVAVVVRPPELSFQQVIREQSKGADLIFMGLAIPDPGQEQAYAEQVMALLEGLPSAILVRNGGAFRGKLV